MKDYYKVEDINKIDLQKLLTDYINLFTRQKLIITTTYKPLEKIEVRFSKRDIHHLLGFHKIQNTKNNATKTLQSILEGRLTIEKIKAHPNYGEMRNRLINYNFLHQCFIDRKIKLCVIPKESGKNPQKLSIVFIDNYNNINMLIGLKVDSRGVYYIPATMYQINDASIYNRTKRTRITNMKWIDY